MQISGPMNLMGPRVPSTQARPPIVQDRDRLGREQEPPRQAQYEVMPRTEASQQVQYANIPPLKTFDETRYAAVSVAEVGRPRAHQQPNGEWIIESSARGEYQQVQIGLDWNEDRSAADLIVEDNSKTQNRRDFRQTMDLYLAIQNGHDLPSPLANKPDRDYRPLVDVAPKTSDMHTREQRDAAKKDTMEDMEFYLMLLDGREVAPQKAAPAVDTNDALQRQQMEQAAFLRRQQEEEIFREDLDFFMTLQKA